MIYPLIIPSNPTHKQIRNAIIHWYQQKPRWWQFRKLKKWLEFSDVFASMDDLVY